MKRIVIAVLVLLMAAPIAYAKSYGGAEIPDTVTIEGNKLVLNGAGVRKKFGLVKVYAGALYLTNKSSDANKILDADEPMMIRMHCIRAGVSPQKLIDSWNESFANITNNNLAPWQAQIDKFNSAFTTETVEDQKYDITYLPAKGLVVYIDGVEKVAIADKKFKRLVFSIWLGDRPLDGGLEKLKNQMLGK
ncbi:MAG: chalcone isomerase family protein [Desulfatibacillum sp.]|nr:chalcone isomerase family protein [Desulfatibacillum sp.]